MKTIETLNGRNVENIVPLCHGQRIAVGGKAAYVLTVNGMWLDDVVKYASTQTLAEFRAMNERNCKMHALRVEEVVVNLEATCLHTGTIVRENRVVCSVGDIAEVDGRRYEIAPDHNGNFKLVPVFATQIGK